VSPRAQNILCHTRRWLLLAAEVLLVLIILFLLAAIWLPAFIGGNPGSVRQ
jgi:hypothetical protein